MNYTDAVTAVTGELADGDTEFAPAGAIQLVLQAWRHLAAADPVWDRLGLTVLDVQGRLYLDGPDVSVEAGPPVDAPQTRTALAALLEHLARHHQGLALGTGALAGRLDHDAAAHQLRDAARALT